MALRHLALILLAAAVAVPPASAQSLGIQNPSAPSPVTLYMHLIDLQDIPINTQKPDDHWSVSNAWGVLTSTTSCLPNNTPGADASTAWHTFYGYSSPSYVEYALQEGGKPRVHPERGISYDALLDPNTPFVLTWYMTTQSAQGLDGAPDPNQVPVPTANVVVSAVMRAGDAISVDDRAYNSGEELVSGKTEPATLLADQVLPGAPGLAPPTHVKALSKLGDGSWLYEFSVPMNIVKPVIPRSTGYNLRIDVSMENPACSGGDHALMPNTVRIHSDPEHRPRMDFAITDPIRIEALHPQFVGDELIVHAAMNAAWGNYDVAEPSQYTPDVGKDGITVSIDGPTPATSLALYNLVSKTNPHYMHQEAVTLVYSWPYKTDHAADGIYTVGITAWNDQHTGRATGKAQFEIGKNVATGCTELRCGDEPVEPTKEGSHGAPALGMPVLLGLVAAAAGIARLGSAPGRRR